MYPALQRLLVNAWVKAEWGASDNNRRARYYTLTAAGRKCLAAEQQEFTRLVGAIHKILGASRVMAHLLFEVTPAAGDIPDRRCVAHRRGRGCLLATRAEGGECESAQRAAG